MTHDWQSSHYPATQPYVQLVQPPVATNLHHQPAPRPAFLPSAHCHQQQLSPPRQFPAPAAILRVYWQAKPAHPDLEKMHGPPQSPHQPQPPVRQTRVIEPEAVPTEYSQEQAQNIPFLSMRNSSVLPITSHIWIMRPSASLSSLAPLRLLGCYS